MRYKEHILKLIQKYESDSESAISAATQMDLDDFMCAA